MTKDVIELAREAGFGMQMALLDDPFAQSHAQRLYQQLAKLAALVAARERERCEKAVENSSSCFTSDQAYIKKLAVAAIRALNTEGEGNAV